MGHSGHSVRAWYSPLRGGGVLAVALKVLWDHQAEHVRVGLTRRQPCLWTARSRRVPYIDLKETRCFGVLRCVSLWGSVMNVSPLWSWTLNLNVLGCYAAWNGAGWSWCHLAEETSAMKIDFTKHTKIDKDWKSSIISGNLIQMECHNWSLWNSNHFTSQFQSEIQINSACHRFRKQRLLFNGELTPSMRLHLLGRRAVAGTGK